MTTHEDIPAQSEDIPGRPVAWAIVGTAITIVICAFIVRGIESGVHGGGASRTVMDISSIPPATPFETPRLGQELERTSQVRELEGWKWVDRDHGRILIPIDLAIDRYVQQRGAP